MDIEVIIWYSPEFKALSDTEIQNYLKSKDITLEQEMPRRISFNIGDQELLLFGVRALLKKHNIPANCITVIAPQETFGVKSNYTWDKDYFKGLFDSYLDALLGL